MALTIRSLVSGGIITNYHCTSRCAHCLYGCSPSWSKNYIDADNTSLICKRIKALGCNSIHIGGGEPFLNPERLFTVLEAIKKADMYIEYIETNSSWVVDKEKSREILHKIKSLGVNTLLISISPFHNEYIAFERVQNLMRLCDEESVGVFPWLEAFADDIKKLDTSKTHKLSEYSEKFGNGYMKSLLSRYPLNLRGRAVLSFSPMLKKIPYEEIVSNSSSCVELSSTSHFHIDCEGNYIPGLCSGFAINYKDLGEQINEKNYPIINALYKDGIVALARVGEKEGFIPKEKGYASKCHLCLEIRGFLVNEKGYNTNEFSPKEYYKEIWPKE